MSPGSSSVSSSMSASSVLMGTRDEAKSSHSKLRLGAIELSNHRSVVPGLGLAVEGLFEVGVVNQDQRTGLEVKVNDP